MIMAACYIWQGDMFPNRLRSLSPDPIAHTSEPLEINVVPAKGLRSGVINQLMLSLTLMDSSTDIARWDRRAP